MFFAFQLERERWNFFWRIFIFHFHCKTPKVGWSPHKYKKSIKKPKISIEPVAADQPAIEAALPAKPPITILDEFSLLSHAV